MHKLVCVCGVVRASVNVSSFKAIGSQNDNTACEHDLEKHKLSCVCVSVCLCVCVFVCLCVCAVCLCVGVSVCGGVRVCGNVVVSSLLRLDPKVMTLV